MSDLPATSGSAADLGSASIEGRVVVVTGGASGVGRAIALAMVEAGARVCVIGRELDRLRETVALAGRGAAILYLQCDVGSVTEIDGVVDFIERFDRPIDVLVHAAGMQVAGGIGAGAVADLDEQYLVNLRGPYLLSQKLLPQLRAARGHVVFVNQSVRANSSGDFGQFAITKAGVTALADALRDEVRADGVRVTSVHPGPVLDEAVLDEAVLDEAVLDEAALESGPGSVPALQPADVARGVLQAVQTPRRVEIADITLQCA